MALTKEQILKADDIKTEVVPVPEWGGDVLVRTLTGTEYDAYQQECFERNGKEITYNLANARSRLCARAIVDDNGASIFTMDDVAALGAKSGKALDRVHTVAARLSGLSADDQEEMAKNSSADLIDDSASV